MDDKYFKDAHYPATKADVIALAEQRGAPQEMIEALQAAQVESFASLDAVRQAVRAADS